MSSDELRKHIDPREFAESWDASSSGAPAIKANIPPPQFEPSIHVVGKAFVTDRYGQGWWVDVENRTIRLANP